MLELGPRDVLKVLFARKYESFSNDRSDLYDSMPAILPRTLPSRSDVSFQKVDLTNVRDAYNSYLEDSGGNETGKKPRTLSVSPLKIGKFPVQMLLRGTLTTNGITQSSHEEYGDKSSFGLELESEDAEGLLWLCEQISGAVQGDAEDVTWHVRNPFRNDVLYLKVKSNAKNTEYTFKSNLKLSPKKPHPDVVRYMNVEVVTEVGAYFSVDDNMCGLFFTPKQVDFYKPPELMDTEESEATQTEESQVLPPTPPRASQPQVSTQQPASRRRAPTQVLKRGS